jgi:hypothetical protein
MTYRDGGLADLNSEVVGGDEGSKTGRVDVLLNLECTEGGAGHGEVGGGSELAGLRVDKNDVSDKLAWFLQMHDRHTGEDQILQRVLDQRSRC